MRGPLRALAVATCAAVIAIATSVRGQEITDFLAADNDFQWLPAIAMGGDGRFVLAWWVQYSREARARLFDAGAQPLGPSFLVGGTSPKLRPSVAMAAAGDFTVVWSTRVVPGHAVRGQRFDASGVPQGAEFAVTAGTGTPVSDPVVAADAAGNTVVAWARGFDSSLPSGNGARVLARRYDAAGTPLGPEFQVSTSTAGHQVMPAVAFLQDGGFVVAWHGTGQDGSADGVFARRYSATGPPVGGEFGVNTYTTGIQAFACVGAAGAGGFVIGWMASDGADDAGPGLFARQFDAAGGPLGPEFRVSDTGRFARNACSVAADGRGGFVFAWASGRHDLSVRRFDGTGATVSPAITIPNGPAGVPHVVTTALAGDATGRLALAWSEFRIFFGDVRGRLFGPAWPLALAVDQSPAVSDGNGVLDPGESVVVAPTWYNTGGSGLPLTGQASSFTGPGGPQNPQYLVFDASADYGALPPGGARGCTATGDCYVLGVSTPMPRPLRHMDATFLERLGNQQSRTWTVHVGGSFDDVPRLDPFYRFAEAMLHHTVSGGCGPTSFCPGAAATREQMAVFLLAAKMGGAYWPPRPAQGVFDDVPAGSPFAPWIEDLWNREIVTGCGVQNYCPSAPVTRAQMSVMLLRSLEGPAYVPPPCTAAVFADVPCTDPFARWINELAARGVTAGCGGGNYCPTGVITRGQMSVFLGRTFGLELYGPASPR